MNPFFGPDSKEIQIWSFITEKRPPGQWHPLQYICKVQSYNTVMCLLFNANACLAIIIWTVHNILHHMYFYRVSCYL
jgi:hypothetical protein